MVDTHIETTLWLIATVLVVVKIIQFAIIWERYQREEE